MCDQLQSLLSDVCQQTSGSNNDYDFCTTYGQKKYWKLRDAFSFWSQYCELANPYKLIGQSEQALNLAERPTNLVPIIFDINLEFHKPQDLQDNQIREIIPLTDKFMLYMVICIQETLDNNFAVEIPGELMCSIFSPSFYIVSATKITVKLRIQFPFFKVHPNVMKQVVFPKCIESFRDKNIIGTLDKQPINDWSGIIDTTVYDNPIPLYGSTKHDKLPTLIYERTLKKMDWVDALNVSSSNDEFITDHLEEDFDKFCRPDFHTHVQKYGIPLSLFQTGVPNEYWIPMIFSINYYYKEMQLISTQLNKVIQNNSYSESGPDYISPSANSLIKEFKLKASRNKVSDFELAQIFLKMINPEKASQECYWLDIGKALFSSTVIGNLDHGLALWKDFTMKAPIKNPRTAVERCDKLYMTFLNDNPITVKTLAWYARHDSPSQYHEWHRHWKQDAMMDAIKAKKREHSIVAEAFYKTFWLEFACYPTGPKTFSWMRYQPGTHHWREVASVVDLLSVLSHEFRDEFRDLKQVLEKEAFDSHDEDVRSRCTEMKNYLEILISNLCDRAYKNNIASTLEEYFNNYEFRGYKDKNLNLMAVKNAVIQCMDTEAVVRPGKPEDYITKFSKVFWDGSIDNKKSEHPSVKRVVKWFRQTYPDDDLCDYVVKLFSSCLQGGNLNKIIPVFTGNGNNSKSMIKKLIEFVFLDYSYTFPTTILTAKAGSSGNASPELALADGCKIGWVQEPGKDQEFMGGMLKILSGQDRLFARKLHDNGGNMVLSFTLFIVCNDIPPVVGDKALENRMRIIPHLSTWVEKHLAPISEQKQFETRTFPLNENFEQKISKMASAALWLFVQYYAVYRAEGLIQPEIVTRYTNAYWNETDPFRIFCRTKIKDVYVPGTQNVDNPKGEKDMKCRLSTDEVYQTYKSWYRHAYPAKIPMTEPVVIKELSKRWMTMPLDGYWYGITVNTPENSGPEFVFS